MKEEKDFFEKLEPNDREVKCVNCGRKIENIEKGCAYCNEKEEYNNSKTYSKNGVAYTLKVIAWIALALGFISSFVTNDSEYDEINFLYLIQTWALYGGAFIGIYAFGEIIQILHDIRERLTNIDND